jgi:hypothetical protein
MPRDTRTGAVAESMLEPALKKGGYQFQPQVAVGLKLNGRKHVVDYLVSKDNLRIIVSKKWQQSGGTAEEKVPYEIICLVNACQTLGFQKAYLVLGGTDADSSRALPGWTLRKFYVSGGLKAFIAYDGIVFVVTMEEFVSLANQGRL